LWYLTDVSKMNEHGTLLSPIVKYLIRKKQEVWKKMAYRDEKRNGCLGV
jgi:hypothetical protein